MALATVLTIVIICASYSQIIEQFPTGGGGYLVASKLLSPTVGVVSGCALIGDYILTIAMSVASGADAVFSMLPVEWQVWKLKFSLGLVVFLTLLNLRGVKESVMLWVPVFFVFVLSYTFAIVWAISAHFGESAQHRPRHGGRRRMPVPRKSAGSAWSPSMLRAYSLGAGTYTGIEAVSNGLNTLREPRVQTGKRTMIYMASSLSFVVGGLAARVSALSRRRRSKAKRSTPCCLEKSPPPGRRLASKSFVIAAMASSGALLFIAAQTGFFGGPRVLANMAVDRWMPTRFATLSDRLVTQNGVLLMGVRGAAAAVFHGGRGQFARRALQHQRLHHLQPFATRHGAALVAGTRAGAEMENKNYHQRLRPAAYRRHSDFALHRQIR